MFPIKSPRTILLTATLLALFAGTASSAMADTPWQKSHPRREEVNNRLANQRARIQNQVNSGDMSLAKAARLRKADHQIRQEERAMASQNGGHITKAEQRVLNQQENALSKRIGT